MDVVLFILSFLLLGCTQHSQAANVDEWRSRSIYQVVTDRFALSDNSTDATCDPAIANYCGGSWRGVINQLDYIKGLGFTAVWISPITYQLQGMTSEGAAYHGYWQQDLYRLNNNFGTADDLKDLAAALHDRGMYLMVDIVVNHLAWKGPELLGDYRIFEPFNSSADFHQPCLISAFTDANATALQQCWLGDNIVALPDLKTESSSVASTLSSWITEFVSNYSIDGLRIDSAINVEPSFFAPFVKASGVFATGEALNGNASVACEYQQNAIGSILDYPLYFPLTRAFNSTDGSMDDLVTQIADINKSCSDPTVLGTFTENHDVSRFPTFTDDLSLAGNVLTFALLHTGIPVIYYGAEQHLAGSTDSNANRQALWQSGYNTSAPLYGQIAKLNALRNHAVTMSDFATTQSAVAYQDSHTIALFRGSKSSNASTLSVLTNTGTGSTEWLLNTTTPFHSRTNLTDILSCNTLMTNATGGVSIPMADGQPIVYFPTGLLNGSGLCGNSLDTKTPSSSPTTSSTSSGQPAQTSKGAAASSHGGAAACSLLGWAATFVGIFIAFL